MLIFLVVKTLIRLLTVSLTILLERLFLILLQSKMALAELSIILRTILLDLWLVFRVLVGDMHARALLLVLIIRAPPMILLQMLVFVLLARIGILFLALVLLRIRVFRALLLPGLVLLLPPPDMTALGNK